MLKEPSTSCCHCLASRVSARGKIMSLPCADYRCNRATCMVDVVSSRFGCCLEKNLKCSFVMTQDDCKQFHEISYFFC